MQVPVWATVRRLCPNAETTGVDEEVMKVKIVSRINPTINQGYWILTEYLLVSQSILLLIGYPSLINTIRSRYSILPT